MTCGEVFFKLIDIVITGTEAAATVAAVYFAVRAYRAQSKQLQILTEDRRHEQISKSPRLTAIWLGGSHPVAVDGRWVEATARLEHPFHNEFDAGTYRSTRAPRPDGLDYWLAIGNLRKEARMVAYEIAAEDPSVGEIKLAEVALTDNERDEKGDVYMLLYRADLGDLNRTIRLRLKFETTTGFESEHVYETVTGTPTFRRVDPPSILAKKMPDDVEE